MPLVIIHPTRGLFVAALNNNPSFSKRRNAAFAFFTTAGEARAELSNWPLNISQFCRVYNTERDLASISDLLSYLERNAKKLQNGLSPWT